MKTVYKNKLFIRQLEGDEVQVELCNVRYRVEGRKIVLVSKFCMCNFKCNRQNIVAEAAKLECRHRNMTTGAEDLFKTVRLMYIANNYTVYKY